jgi:membrane-associated protein
MIELFKHILHLDFEWIFAHYDNMIYIILFLVIFIETGVVIMPFLPGDSLLFTAGLFARLGYLNLAVLFLLLFIAAVLGDNTNYWIGRKLGLRVLQIKFRGKSIVKQKYLDQTHQFFEKHGTKAIIMARFVPIVRTVTPFVAGIGKMKYSRFFSFDVVGGFLWIGSMTLAGYFLGTIPWIKDNIELVALGIVFISATPMMIQIVKGFLNKRKKTNT